MMAARFFRSTAAVAVALGGLGVVVFFWDSLRSVEALFRENEELQNALARLRHEEAVAYFWLLDEPAAGRLEVAWLELPAAGGPPAGFRTLTLRGQETFFDALLVKLPGQLVADGEGRALIIWRRAFGSGQAPESGPVFEIAGSVPERYEGWLEGALDPRDVARFWDAVWDLAHQPGRLERLGIEAVYANAVSVAPRRGWFYTVRLSGTGAVSVQAAPMSEAPAELVPMSASSS